MTDGAAFIPASAPTTAMDALLALERTDYPNRRAEIEATQNLCVTVRNEVARHSEFIATQALSWVQNQVAKDVAVAEELRSVFNAVERLDERASDEQFADALRALDAVEGVAGRLEAHAEHMDKTLGKLDAPLDELHRLQAAWPTLRKTYL